MVEIEYIHWIELSEYRDSILFFKKEKNFGQNSILLFLFFFFYTHWLKANKDKFVNKQ